MLPTPSPSPQPNENPADQPFQSSNSILSSYESLKEGISRLVQTVALLQDQRDTLSKELQCKENMEATNDIGKHLLIIQQGLWAANLSLQQIEPQE